MPVSQKESFSWGKGHEILRSSDLVTLKQERVLDSDKQDNRRSQPRVGTPACEIHGAEPCPKWYQQ